MEEIIKSVRIDNIDHQVLTPSYSDSDIAFFDDVRQMEVSDTVRLEGNVFAMCEKGRARLEVNGEVTELHPYELLLCPANYILNNIMLSPDLQAKVAFISDRAIKATLGQYVNIWNEAMYLNHVHVYPLDESNRQLFDRFYQIAKLILAEKDNPFRPQIVQGIAQVILFELTNMLSRDNSHKPTLTQGETLFDRFLNLLTSAEVKRHPVEFYATQLCVSPKYLSMVCKQVSGRSASDLIHEYVDADVKRYLSHTTLSIKEISNRLGFPNLSFFGKYVKQHFGLSPNAYRKQ